MNNHKISEQIANGTANAVAHYWQTRAAQRKKQETGGKADQGLRSAVTGGAQMDGFIELFSRLITQAGIPLDCIFRKKAVELPGFFKPTKEWDLLVVRERTLIAAIEAKSQVGPSFGNNFNNRTEEAIGSALDLWTAFRDKAYLNSPQPFLGYFFMLEDCKASCACFRSPGIRSLIRFAVPEQQWLRPSDLITTASEWKLTPSTAIWPHAILKQKMLDCFQRRN